MPLPLMLGMSALQGGAGVISGFAQADAERKRIREKNAQIDAAKARVEAERNKLRQDTKSLSTDFITNYVTVRDPNKAEGIRQSYGQNMSMYKQGDAQLESSIANLEAQKEANGMSPMSAGLIGLGTGIASGIASTIGSGRSTPDTLGFNPTKGTQIPSIESISPRIDNQFGSTSAFTFDPFRKKQGFSTYDLMG